MIIRDDDRFAQKGIGQLLIRGGVQAILMQVKFLFQLRPLSNKVFAGLQDNEEPRL